MWPREQIILEHVIRFIFFEDLGVSLRLSRLCFRARMDAERATERQEITGQRFDHSRSRVLDRRSVAGSGRDVALGSQLALVFLEVFHRSSHHCRDLELVVTPLAFRVFSYHRIKER